MATRWITSGFTLCALFADSAWSVSAGGETPAAISDTVPAAKELAPGVYALGSPQRFGAANVGWVIFEDHVTLIGAPHPERLASCLAAVARVTEKPVRRAVLTHVRGGEPEAVRALVRKGIEIVVAEEAAKPLRDALATPPNTPAPSRLQTFANRLVLHDGHQRLEVIALGRAAGPADAAVYLPQPQVLFAGAVCVNGPRAELPGSDTLGRLRALQQLRGLSCRTVVPGFGSVGSPAVLERQERYLRELRRQVAHLVAQGRTPADVVAGVKIAPTYLVWMPYDQPSPEDIGHVYRELTVPYAPFGGTPPAPAARPRALVLVGDRPHDPGHIEEGLRRALEGAGVETYVAFDARALTAENLKAVQLLVMLRDGLVWPGGDEKPGVGWMTPEQERAVVEFVERGNGFLPLHNSTALYPEGGPFLKLVGGTYRGHGPLEVFRVEVVDRSHPVTRGVTDFEVADEQHTPAPDLERVHLLLKNRSASGEVAAAGWAYRAGRGRVCYLANGHTREAQNHPAYQTLLRNAARWCLGLDGGGEGR